MTELPVPDSRSTAVVTVVAARHDHLRAQRRALARGSSVPELHVVVSMGDPAIASVLAEQANLPSRLIELPVGSNRLPLAAARNAGAAAAMAAGADVLVMLDVDCLPGPELISRYEVAAAATELGSSGLLAGPVTYLPAAPAGSWTPETLTAHRAPHAARPDPAPGVLEPGDHHLFWSLSFALRADVWRRLGGFCTEYVGYGGEDTDFAMVAKELEVPLYWVGGADAFHQHHPVSSPPVEHVDDIVRNGAIFAARWGWWPMLGWLEAFERSGLVSRTASGWQAVEPVTLASIPARHPYVEAVRPANAFPVAVDRVRGWAPDPLLEPAYLSAHARSIEVVHLHFGYDHLDVPTMEAWLTQLADERLPLVVTLHDLRNPHHPSRELHDAHLKRLLAAADDVLTLTAGAAEEIQQHFGRTATVVSHPTLLEADVVPSATTEPGLVVLHLKSMRPNVGDPQGLVRAAAEGARRAGGRLRVDVHPEAHDRADLRAIAARGDVEVMIHDRFSDDELFEYLCRAHVSVLPYRFGTHSGWLELCRDLGTRVVAPTCGYFADQWQDVVSYSHDEIVGLIEESLTRAVAEALSTPPPSPADRAGRLAQLADVKAIHADIYRRVRRR